jgi:hypothetical protein
MVISKKSIESLIDVVVIPFERYLLEDKMVVELLHDDNVRAKHNIAIAKFAIELLTNIMMARETAYKAAKAHREHNIELEHMQKYLTVFFKLHSEWTAKHFKADEFYEELMQIFNNLYIRLHSEAEESTFLQFDSEEIDEAIESMHYDDKQKITAAEYATYNEVLEDELHSIIELKQDCEHIMQMHESIEDSYVQEYSLVIRTLASVLFSTMEFKDIGYALNNFNIELLALDLSSLDDVQRDFVFTLLNQMNEDIQQWIESVFITKDAIDIHYFDASFLANIAQFSIMVEQVGSDEDASDEDDFLF